MSKSEQQKAGAEVGGVGIVGKNIPWRKKANAKAPWWKNMTVSRKPKKACVAGPQ